MGFEPTPGYPDEKPAGAGKLSLESHALDRSAILPCNTQLIAEIRAYPRLYDLKSEVRGKVWAREKRCDIHRQQRLSFGIPGIEDDGQHSSQWGDLGPHQ